MKKIISFLFIAVALVTTIYLNFDKIENLVKTDDKSTEKTTPSIALTETLKAHYIDVGQGDAIFIELPNQETMLIDAGENEYKEKVENYIKNLGYQEITYLVGTHPHSDHIGSLAHIINKFTIKNIYMPKAKSNSNTYLNLLETIKSKNLTITKAKKGINILTTDNLVIDIIGPVQEYTNLNDTSAVIKMTYQDNTYLFTGDAEKIAEEDLTLDFKVDVLKVGHHGSDTSSSDYLVNSIDPKYAIISVGTDNKYDHPSPSVVSKWQNDNAKVYQTNLCGNIVVESNGKDISITECQKTTEQVNMKKIDSITVKKGTKATYETILEPNTLYDIKIKLNSGESTAKGLENKTSDSLGNISWTWNISSNTKVGEYQIIIESEKDSYYTTLIIEE